MSRYFCLAVMGAALLTSGCVTRSAFEELETEFKELSSAHGELTKNAERLAIERDSLEEQFLDAQEAFEDERVARSSLATNYDQVTKKATKLDSALEEERRARLAAAQALAAREAEIAAMQSTYDELVGDLESELASGEIEIERLREGLSLNVSDDVLFASGSADLDRSGRNVLVKVAGRLASMTDFIEVRGYTDNRPIRGSLAQRYPSNWELAAARAASVVRLLEETGVPGERLVVVSYGPNEPVAANDTAANRALNRRIEIRLQPAAARAKQMAAEN